MHSFCENYKTNSWWRKELTTAPFGMFIEIVFNIEVESTFKQMSDVHTFTQIQARDQSVFTD